MNNKFVVAVLLLLIVMAFWLFFRRRRQKRAKALSTVPAGVTSVDGPTNRGSPEDTPVVDAGAAALAERPSEIPGRRLILVSSVFALPVLFVGVLFISFASSTIGVASGLLAHGVLYPVVAAKARWRVHARLARTLAVVSTVAGLLIVIQLARLLAVGLASPVAALVFYLLHVVAAVLLCVGVFRYSAADAFIPKRPRTGSRFSSETPRTGRVLGIAFAAVIGAVVVAAVLAYSPLIDRFRGLGTAPAASHGAPAAASDPGARPKSPGEGSIAPAK